jgi:hypothetical protein
LSIATRGVCPARNAATGRSNPRCTTVCQPRIWPEPSIWYL